VSRFVEPPLAEGRAARAHARAVDEGLDALFAMRASRGARSRATCAAARARRRARGRGRAALGLVQEAARERLRKRARQLEAETGLLDEARLHQEIAIAAERMDVNEEIVRLRSHVDQFRELLEAAGRPAGRAASSSSCSRSSCARRTRSARRAATAPIAHWVWS
jgi:uncharacterized protein (TIGR00255 family)